MEDEEDEKAGTSLSDQLDCIARIGDAAARLNAEMADADADSMVEIWRASDEIKRRREVPRPRPKRPQRDGDRHRRERPQINTHLPPGMFRIEEIHNGVTELIKITTVAGKMLGATPGARGGSIVNSNVADVRLGAAGDMGSIFLWLTGERPRRKVRKVKRKGVRGGKHSITAGPWHGFLAAIMEKIFGDTKGIDGYSQKVVRAMKKTSPNTG